MKVSRTPPGDNVVVAWATNLRYPSRLHMTNGRGRVSLCGFPVDSLAGQRPDGPRVCPDCAIVFVEESFPSHEEPRIPPQPHEWFRRLPAELT